MIRGLVILLAGAAAASGFQAPDVATILRRSIEANQADWKAAPDYDYSERDRKPSGSMTYRVWMIEGSPYRQLVAVNGKPLSAHDQKERQEELQRVIAQRNSESASHRTERVAKYQQDRERDHILMQQLTQAFNFRLVGERRQRGFTVYVLHATPRPGYQPPNTDSEVLTGMRGTLWVDTRTYQWVKVEAQVVRPVSIAGFLARVQPGTRFELEKMPVGDGIWQPKHFAMQSNARVLFLFRRDAQEDETYFNYKKAAGSTSLVHGVLAARRCYDCGSIQ
ncbi:MAG TPA: hypothetical protein VMH80_14035 [Bryobacteraceae bacterium]|nr:hypothetical protein [Bryobacteraceae bacterium]